MKKLTVLTAAFAAGLTSFAANSAPYPAHSPRADGIESAPVAKSRDKSTAKDAKQQEKATARTEARQPRKPNGKAEVVKTPLFRFTGAAAETKQAAKPRDKSTARDAKRQEKATARTEARQPRKPNAKAEVVKTPLFRFTGAAAETKQAAEKSEPKSKRVAQKSAPRKERAAEKKSSTRKQVAQKKSPKSEQVAEKRTPKKKQVAEKRAPKAEKVVAKSAPKPRQGGDRQVAVKESVAVDLVETASIGNKGAKTMKGAGGKYSAIIAQYAASYGVPVSLAHAVIQVESNYRPNARGSAGEIGLMQIKPSTARMMGYSGSTQGLFHPETNIKFGMKYLAKAQELGGGTTCGTILKYNAGHGAKRMNPVSSAYCVKVKRFLGV